MAWTERTKMPNIEVGLEPCCAAHRSVILSMMNREQSRKTPVTKRHLQKCSRCRSYFDLLDAQRHHSGLSRSALDQGRIPLLSTIDFERWLESALRRRSRTQLSADLCAFGRRLLSSDPVIRESAFEAKGLRSSPGQISRQVRKALDETELSSKVRLGLRRDLKSATEKTFNIKIVLKLANYAEELAPDYTAPAVFLRGVSLMFSGNEAHAGPLFDESSRTLRSPRSIAAALTNVAVLRLGEEDPEGAVRWAREAIARYPNHTGARFNLSLVYAALGKQLQASSVLPSASAMSLSRWYPFPRAYQSTKNLIRLLSPAAPRQRLVWNTLRGLYGMEGALDTEAIR